MTKLSKYHHILLCGMTLTLGISEIYITLTVVSMLYNGS